MNDLGLSHTLLPVHVAANFWEPYHVLRVQVHAPINSRTSTCTIIRNMANNRQYPNSLIYFTPLTSANEKDQI